jgi:hypothetical protein
MNRITIPTVLVDFGRNYDKPRRITDNNSGRPLTNPIILFAQFALLTLFSFGFTSVLGSGTQCQILAGLLVAHYAVASTSMVSAAPQFYSSHFQIRSSPPDDKRFGDSAERKPLQLLDLSILISSRGWKSVVNLYG